MMFAYMGGGAAEQWIRNEYKRRGMRIDMGKSCLRFKSLADVDLDVLGEAIRMAPTKKFIDMYFTSVGPGAWKTKGAKTAKKTPAKNASAKKAPAKRAAAKKK